MIGRTIGKYRIVGQVGRGGAGIVYKAVDETLNRDVAIKTLNPDLANTEVMKRFRAEASILAKLNHPQIATIYELFRSDADLLMVMEFVRGETLDRVCQRRGAIAPDGAAYLVDQILSALEHAHRAGIVHRDMKPANVMVTEAGGVKIMDFGIARVRGAEQMTVDGRLMGTPAYMPPEQVLGHEVDGRADLYSVGVVFYRLLAGALPFTADTALAMMQQQILETPRPLRLQRADLPDWCEPIVRRALAKSPADRFQTAEGFREELGRAAGLLVPADLARTFAVPAGEGDTGASAPLRPGDTIDLSRLHAVPAPSVSMPVEAAAPVRRARFRPSHAAAAVAAAGAAALIGYVTLRPPATAAPMVPPAPRHAATEPASPKPVAVAEPALPKKVALGTPAPVPPPPPASPEPVVKTSAARVAPAERMTSAPAVQPSNVSAASAAAPLTFPTRAIVGARRPREHDAQLVLANGRITVTSDLEAEYPFYDIPYHSVISISYSRGRDPMWNSPLGPTPVTRGGGTLGRLGIVVARNWISLRTSTTDQFVAMRFDDVLVRRVLLALEERTGRAPELIAEPKDAK